VQSGLEFLVTSLVLVINGAIGLVRIVNDRLQQLLEILILMRASVQHRSLLILRVQDVVIRVCFGRCLCRCDRVHYALSLDPGAECRVVLSS